ncbi:MAG: hypothetical protein M3Q49_06470 [Actinomycetota bacterium]|nr:hypothetical protein [Actinomycetota bacterium]
MSKATVGRASKRLYNDLVLRRAHHQSFRGILPGLRGHRPQGHEGIRKGTGV